MEHRLNWMCGSYILRFYFIVAALLLYSIGEGKSDKTKGNKISFFHRHYDSVASYYHNGKLVNSTRDNKGNHLDGVSVQFIAFGRQFLLDLRLNRNLFSNAYVTKVFHSHGQSTETNHISHPQENCYYHGSLRFHPESDAAISTCDGLRGYITDRRDTYHIEPINGRIHRVYRNRDKRDLPFKCGTEGHDARLNTHKSVIGRHKRSINAPYDSDLKTRYVELYLVNDYRTYERHGKNLVAIVKRSQDIANIVSSLYRQLNIYVALVGVEIWSGGDLVSISTSADNTMENFLRYRKERINPYHHNDNAQLITGVYFDHGVVGKAIKGPICTHQFSGGVNMDYGGLVTLVATTVAHEMGHNFGMEHDNDTMCECSEDKCIMAATSGQLSPRRWSTCSQIALAEAFELGMDYCLKNLPTTIYDGPICGNGMKEEGEECDCGLPQDCDNRCCNATSCRLHSQAQCGTGKCCDIRECRFKAVATKCREAVSECDLAEYCNGTSEYCPNDVYISNGVECKHGESYCYSGRCKTHTDQCKLLWGDSGRVSDPVCFQSLNTKGENDGNCGYNWTSGRYKRCDKENVMCGLLHCVHLNEKLMFWRDNLAIDMEASFIARGNLQYVCRTAMLDVGLDMPDPGLVPDGAKCEEDKICINQQCVPLAKLQVEDCPDNCHGHGRCNSRGNCHCNVGYAPPLCDQPGYGGSVDSGPASDEYAKKDLLIALLVVFLLVIPLVVLGVIAFLNRRRLLQWWKTMPNFKYRLPGKTCKKTKQPPPDPKPKKSQNKKKYDPPPYREGLISNPMLDNSTHTSDVHHKPKIWNPVTNWSNNRATPVAPPPRPSAPQRPPSVVKSNSSLENKSAAKKVRLSTPIQETGGPPSPASQQKLGGQFVTSMTTKQEPAKNASQPQKSTAIVKRESFRGSEISDPILVCTTNRNSLVLADGNVDIIGPEARMVSRSPSMNRPVSVTVKRSQSERPVSRAEPAKPGSQSPGLSGGTLKKSASTRAPASIHEPSASAPVSMSATDSSGNAKSTLSGFRPRPVPAIPTYEEDDTQPIYTNETDDLLSAIEGALKDSANLYNNMSPSGQVHSPIQETAPPCPPRTTSTRPGSAKPTSSTSSSSKPTGAPANKPVSVQKPTNTGAGSVSRPGDSSKDKPSKDANNTNKKQPTMSKPTNICLSASKSNAGDKIPTDISSKPSIDNSGKLQSAVSDELRNKILSRSGSSVTQPSSKTPTSQSSVSTGFSQKPTTTTNAKAPGSDVKKTLGSSSTKSSAPNLSSSGNEPSRPARSTKTTNNPKTLQQDSKTVLSKGNSVNTTSANTNRPKSTIGQASTDKASPAASKQGSSAKTNVSSIAAKFSKSPEADVSKGAQSEDEGKGKRAMVRKASSFDKPALTGKPSAAGSPKPDLSVNRVQSMTGGSRPSLPPKPGEPANAPSSTASVGSAAQTKRVQSFRI